MNKKNKSSTPAKKKVSRNELIRKAQALQEQNEALIKNATAATENYKALVLTATRLYEINPDDEIFSKNIFQPSFIELIKDQVEKRKEKFQGELKETVAEARKATETAHE